jgi:hypothetical protein
MIILTHHTGEPHGVLGAQAAATTISEKLSVACIVVGLQRQFSVENLLAFVEQHYRGSDRIVAFSHLCGRKDIFELIPLLHAAGYRTILAGPQAAQDYRGEPGWEDHPHRFRGLKDCIDLAFHGPVDLLTRSQLVEETGCIEVPWKTDLSLHTDWSNIYLFGESIEKLDVQVVQVLSAIGCPWAARGSDVLIDPPSNLKDRLPALSVKTSGCVFCDVARDKGFYGQMGRETVLVQVGNVPEKDGRKIAFELIDEYPIKTLLKLLHDVEEEGLHLSQINLVLRVDDINRHTQALEEILGHARERRLIIMLSSIGFESFSDAILRNLNKGISVDDIVKCVTSLRRLKERFGSTLLYRRDEGANHGFIHPTPWDDAETIPEMNRNIFIHRFFEDILPEHSIPLIIHHASFLADWIREIEARTGLIFHRDGTWIEWWSL